VAKTLTLILSFLFCFSSQALTPEEESQFRAKVENSNSLEIGFMTAIYLQRIPIQCSSGLSLTFFSIIDESFPGLLRMGKVMIEEQLNQRQTLATFEKDPHTIKPGGISGLVIEFFKAHKSDANPTLSLKWFRDTLQKAYSTSEQTFNIFYGESGYCIDSFERLKILSAPK